jgi:acetyl-CoA C-acetyltransferase
MVSGVGMHMTKHAFGLYSTTPPDGRLERPAPLPPPAKVEIADRHEGPATIASYTVAHARTGEPEWGLVIGDVPGGRVYGRVEDPDLLAAMEAEEFVGRTVALVPGDNVNLVKGS